MEFPVLSSAGICSSISWWSLSTRKRREWPRLLLLRATYKTSVAERDQLYDVFPNGERFVMLEDTGSEPPAIHIVLSWVEELEERMPVP
jgi:hypothetical protein